VVSLRLGCREIEKIPNETTKHISIGNTLGYCFSNWQAKGTVAYTAQLESHPLGLWLNQGSNRARNKMVLYI